MLSSSKASDNETTEKLLSEIEQAILTAHALNKPFLVHLLQMAFWEANHGAAFWDTNFADGAMEKLIAHHKSEKRKA